MGIFPTAFPGRGGEPGLYRAAASPGNSEKLQIHTECRARDVTPGVSQAETRFPPRFSAALANAFGALTGTQLGESFTCRRLQALTALSVHYGQGTAYLKIYLIS